jgi:tyrosyl-tRNA synthetase
MIGDPSGRSVTRPQLTHEQVIENAKSYTAQAMKILDQARTEIVFNGDWFKTMTFQHVIQLNSRVTLQQILQREDFRTRLDKQEPIHAHEIQYPLMQGWDSVMVQADVELGGTDQLFNILVGRDLQKEQGLPQQVVMLLPILEGLDGTKKMSKSLGNHIALNETPNEMFGKLMSISDEMMARYYSLLLNRELPSDLHPLEAKKRLALEITSTYQTPEAAEKTLQDWNHRFSEKKFTEADLPEFTPSENALEAIVIVAAVFEKNFGIKKSRTDVRRLITQGSVQLDGTKVTDPKAVLALRSGQVLRLDKTHAVRVG